LVLPPKLAPIQVVIVPIYKGEKQLEEISEKVNIIVKELRARNISVKFDNRDTHKPGFKFAEYELKGVPLRVAIGPRDMENETCEIARRDTFTKETIKQTELVDYVEKLLIEIQDSIYNKALNYRNNNIHRVDNFEDFKQAIKKGGFVSAHWDGTKETELKIKELTKATLRCVPVENEKEDGFCVLTGKPSKERVLFAKAY